MQNPTSIQRISHRVNLGNTPARVNHRTGTLYINDLVWGGLSPDQRYYILLHEQGHLALQTRDENKVDAWAFEQYVKSGRPLSQAVLAMSRTFPFKTQEQKDRLFAQVDRALDYDFNTNGNPLADPDLLYHYLGLDGFLGPALLLGKAKKEGVFSDIKNYFSSQSIAKRKAAKASADAKALEAAAGSSPLTSEKSNMVPILIGVGILVVIIALYFTFRKK